MNHEWNGGDFELNSFGLGVWEDIELARLTVGGGYSGYASHHVDYYYTAPAGVDRELFFTVPFNFGQPFSIGVFMHSVIKTSGNQFDNQAHITHDAMNTASWNGVSTIGDQNNESLATDKYSLTSDSGFNWLSAFGIVPPLVPEPTLEVKGDEV